MPLPAAEQCQGQDLISNNALPIDIIGPHTLEDVKHLIHGVEHHARACPSPFLDAGHACLSIISRHLKICETFIDVPPKMLVVFAKHGIEAPPKDGSKPVKKNQITCPIILLTKCEFYDVHALDVLQVLTGRLWPFHSQIKNICYLGHQPALFMYTGGIPQGINSLPR